MCFASKGPHPQPLVCTQHHVGAVPFYSTYTQILECKTSSNTFTDPYHPQHGQYRSRTIQGAHSSIVNSLAVPGSVLKIQDDYSYPVYLQILIQQKYSTVHLTSWHPRYATEFGGPLSSASATSVVSHRRHGPRSAPQQVRNRQMLPCDRQNHSIPRRR